MPKSASMVFLRAKKINNHVYYYLVKSVRINGKVRQKVVKYIGKSKNLISMLKYQKSKSRKSKISDDHRKLLNNLSRISDYDQKSKFLTNVEQK